MHKACKALLIHSDSQTCCQEQDGYIALAETTLSLSPKNPTPTHTESACFPLAE